MEDMRDPSLDAATHWEVAPSPLESKHQWHGGIEIRGFYVIESQELTRFCSEYILNVIEIQQKRNCFQLLSCLS